MLSIIALHQESDDWRNILISFIDAKVCGWNLGFCQYRGEEAVGGVDSGDGAEVGASG